MDRLKNKHGDLFTTYSFGVDRDRPFPEDRASKPWYAQKFTTIELMQLQRENLIPVEVAIPDIEGAFTNP